MALITAMQFKIRGRRDYDNEDGDAVGKIQWAVRIMKMMATAIISTKTTTVIEEV